MIKRAELELGGNSPFVVLEDADLEQTVEAAVFGKFLHQGQICMIANRLIIHERLYEAFAERFADRVEQLRVGDPDAPDTMIGPVINQRQLDGLVGRIAEARESGARELVFSPFGGEKNSGIGRFNGRWAVDAFTTDHWITVQHVPRPYPADARELQGPWSGG